MGETPMIDALRSLIESVDHPYCSYFHPSLKIIPTEETYTGAGLVIPVDEWYLEGEPHKYDDGVELTNVDKIEFELQPDGNYVNCYVYSNYDATGKIEVVETVHEDLE